MNPSLKKRIDTWLDQDPRLAFMERIRLAEESETLFAGLPYAIRYARTFEHILQNITVPFEDGLFAGAVERVVPSPEEYQAATELYKRWWDMPLEDFQKTAFWCFSFQKNKTDWLASRPPWLLAQGHLSFDWKALVNEGLGSFARCARARKADEADPDKQNYLEGLALSVEAMQAYIRRYAAVAEEHGRPDRRDLLLRLADSAPSTFFEALQLITLVMLSTKRVIGYDAGCYGRMDQYLLPFYERDLAEGRITRESALDIIEEFLFKDLEGAALFDHMSADSEETQMRLDVSGEDVAYVIVGGRTLDGKSCINELSHLFVEAVGELNMLKSPVIIVRYFDGVDEDFFQKMCRSMVAGGSLYVYNDETQIRSFIRYGVDPEDAAEYGIFSCNNPTIPAMMGSLRQIWFNLAIPFELVLGRGRPLDQADKEKEKKDCEFSLRDRLMGMMESGYNGIDTGALTDITSMDDFLAAYKKQFSYLLGEFRKGVEADCAIEKKENVGRMRIEDCFLQGTIENACDWITGGVKYHKMMIQGSGLATVVDSLYAIDQLVFQEKSLTLAQLRDILASNFEGQEFLLRRLTNKIKKFGNDIPEVDSYAKKLVEIFTDAISRQNSPEYLYTFMAGISTLRDYTTMGAYVGATPNGRLAGAPLSENQSPCEGMDISGLTALLNSISKIPFDRITGGPLNIKLHPSVVAGPEGIEKLSALFRTYFENGGMQLQISVVDANTLRAAQLTPEKYKGLTVRVTGYNAYFTHMSKQGQEEIIHRTEHGSF